MALEVIQIINEPVSSNCFVLFDKENNNNCLIVDPGCEFPQKLFAVLSENELQPEFIILTHEHFDHIWGCNDLFSRYNTPIICSEICSLAIQDAKKNHSLFYNQKGFTVPEAKFTIEKLNFKLVWNSFQVDFFISEGHTNAGVCILIDKFLFTGDTLIKDCKTVTKLFCGSKDKLILSIEKINSLKGNDYKIFPGHGEIFDLDNYDLNKALK